VTRCPPVGTLVIAHRRPDKWKGIVEFGPMIGRVSGVSQPFYDVPGSQAFLRVDVGSERYAFSQDECRPAAQPVERTMCSWTVRGRG